MTRPGDVLRLPGAELWLCADWLDRPTADAWLAGLREEIAWSQPRVRVFGREHPVPRLVAWYGDPEAAYGYSGIRHPALPWTPLLAEVRSRVCEAVGVPFNGVLANLYRDGQDAMGWHSDDEAVLGPEPVIASVSLGAVRRFDLRARGTQRIGHSLWLAHGSLLVMRGATQHHWHHHVARSRRVGDARLNLTFRWIRTNSP